MPLLCPSPLLQSIITHLRAVACVAHIAPLTPSLSPVINVQIKGERAFLGIKQEEKPFELVLNAADKAKLAVANLDPGATLTSLASPSAKVGLLADEVVAPVHTITVACHVVEHQARGMLHCHRYLHVLK